MGAVRPAVTANNAAYTASPDLTGAYVDNTKFIPELFSKKTLRNFYASTFYQDIFNTD